LLRNDCELIRINDVAGRAGQQWPVWETEVAPMTDSAIKKYLNERIPRYTSYPTAPHFSAAVGPLSYADWLKAVPDTAKLSLYLHVPFCETLCWYCGCHTSITRHRAPIEKYVATLEREISHVADIIGGHRVAHIHWGGGTPSIVGAELFQGVMSRLRQLFSVEPDAEVAIEVDPRRLTAEMAAAIGLGGVTRASLGIQTFDPMVQEAVGRIQTLEMTQACANLLRGAGIKDLNVDLLYGLPHETVESCEASVGAALTLNPARISVFGYAHVPGMMKHQKVIDEAALPNADERLRQEKAIGDTLVRAGYQRIGLDHYARPDDTLAVAQTTGQLRRNFQGYTDDPADALIGFGASSIGRLPQGYVQNAPGLKDWGDKIEAGELATVRGIAITPEDDLRGDIIERLMCDLRADVPAAIRRHGFKAGWLDTELSGLEPLVADGLARIEDGVITVPETSRNLVRRVASQFDAYLDPTAGRHAVAV
jgi:oxygen-independent coproporphyrinogen III oxidase